MQPTTPEPQLPSRTVVLAVATDLGTALAAIGAGAGLVDLWDAGPAIVAQVRQRHPEVPACARADWAVVVRDLATARRTGAVLACADAGEAAAAQAAGIDSGALLVAAQPGQAVALIESGWRVIVVTDEAASPHAAAAVGALACWLGAAAVRAAPAHVAAVRRAIDMAEAIMGGEAGR